MTADVSRRRKRHKTATSVACLISLSILAACAQYSGHSTVKWTQGSADGAALPHYKAYATNAFGDGGWLSGASDPWSAVTYALEHCRALSSIRCRIKQLGNSSVADFEEDELHAALMTYSSDEDASFDDLENLPEVATANQLDQIPSVVAMAVVPQRGRQYWAMELGDTFKDAERAALSACGHSDCVVVGYYTGNHCALVVAGDTQIFWAGEPEYGVDEVMSLCATESSHCEIVKRACPEQRVQS